MITCKGRLSYVQCFPPKPLRRGIKVLMLCDVDTAYLQQLELYLGLQQNSVYDLGYDMVMRLC